MPKKFLIMFLVISIIGVVQNARCEFKEILHNEEDGEVILTPQNHRGEEFGNDVIITNQYTPHTFVSLASDYGANETFCAIRAVYNGYPAVLIYKTNDGGHNWSFFGGTYNTTANSLDWPDISVTKNYVCVAYTYSEASDLWIQTYRKPRSGGTGNFFTFPQHPATWPDLSSYEGYSPSGDTIDLVLNYWYSYPNRCTVYYQSTNGGYSWFKEYSFELGTKAWVPTVSRSIGYIYIVWQTVGTQPGDYILRFARSINNGTSWYTKDIANPYPFNEKAGLCSDQNSVYVFVSNSDLNLGEVFISYNYGEDWQSSYLSDVYGGYSAEFSNYAYVASTSNGIAKCQRGTTTSHFTGHWERVSDSNDAFWYAISTNPISLAVVAWIDSSDGTYKAYCDGWNWTGVEETKKVTINKNFRLYQNYPNPVSSETRICYAIAKKCKVELGIFNACGRNISTLVDEVQDPGQHQATWDIRSIPREQLPNGVYFYRLKAGNFTDTKKMVIVR